MQINVFIILCTGRESGKKNLPPGGCCRCKASASPVPLAEGCLPRAPHPLGRHICACSPLTGLKGAVWYLFVFLGCDLEQHLRLIDQSLCRQTKCGDTSRRLMRCDLWQAGEAVNHHEWVWCIQMSHSSLLVHFKEDYSFWGKYRGHNSKVSLKAFLCRIKALFSLNALSVFEGGVCFWRHSSSESI